MLDLVFRNQTKSKAFSRAFFGRVLEESLGVLKLKGTFGISVNLAGPAKIRALNKKYRHKDAPTDVLSFPLADKPIPAYNETRDLGDIFICPTVVTVKAGEAGKTSRQYMAWVTVHGLLHLLGYDHEKSSAAAKKMFALEKKILKKL